MDVFNLWAKIGLDTNDYEKGLDSASGKTHSFGEKLKTGLAAAAKAGAAAITAASAAIGVLTKQSIDGYAEYEQLVGGVETLFGLSSDKVMQYANSAYKTAGLSANAYMETVTSFSASLLQGLGGNTELAADIADKAIVDMSDNANKMGTSMEMIQNAYQGFAKQNYTMLDNLKLGYGGTASEMARLINDSGILGDTIEVTADTVNNVSFDQIIEAIHVVQDRMGITGTTAAEAASTIQGSVASMKSAWENLVTGIADENANLDVLIGNFVDSVFTAVDNVVPRLQQIINGVGDAIEKIAPIIAEKLPQIVTDLLPPLLEAGGNLLQAIMDGIIVALPALTDAALQVILMFTNFILENLPALVEAGLQIITTLAFGIADALPELIPTIVDVILQIVDTLTNPDVLSVLLDAAIQIMTALAVGLIDALPELLAKVPEILVNLGVALAQSIPQLLESVGEIGAAIVQGIWDGITGAGQWLTEQISGFFTGVIDGVKDLLGIHSPSRVFAGIGKNMALGLGSGWEDEFSHIKGQIEGGMDFGTTTMDFAASGLAQSSKAIAGGVVGAAEIGGERDITINLTAVLDGSVLARAMHRYNASEDARRGIALAQG